MQWTQIAELGPRLAFLGSIALVFVVWITSARTLQSEFVGPLVSTVFLMLAAGSGVIGWYRRSSESEDVTYADVAGALTLIGLCITATINPDQLVQLVHGGQEYP